MSVGNEIRIKERQRPPRTSLLGVDPLESTITRFQKIFGSGPIGVLTSLILLGITFWGETQWTSLKISDHQELLTTAFIILSGIALVIIIWSVKSLPASERGNHLCTSGAFKYVRHPLYAAFLSVFDFGLALYLNSYLFILWAICVHPLWHYLIRYEEQLMIRIFKEDYVEYQKKTGRFFPKLWKN